MLQAHRLARALNHHDVGAMLDSMPAPQFWHWIALNNIDPWTAERGDVQAAIVASTVANALGRKQFKVADFMPDWQGKRRVTDPDAMKAMLKATAAAARNR